MKEIKTFFIKTYGCQMNELDSEILSTQLENKDLTQVQDESSADIVILNTCSVRDMAEQKVFGQLYKLKENNKIVGIAGCMAVSKKQELIKQFPFVDFLIGTNNLLDISQTIDNILTKNQKIYKTSKFHETGLEDILINRQNKLKASVSIIRGCNNYCSYCIVPFTRGKEVSRSKESIIKEVKILAKNGYKEITLLGQNVNSYGNDFKDKTTSFPDLLYNLNKIDGIERIRFMTSHPKDISIDLMHAIRDLEKICEFVHFPIQSGSNRILKKMQRSYLKEEYLEKVFKLKEIVPKATIGTDIIVGFPTETEEEFLETHDVFKLVNYDTAFIFAYSPREKTPAIKWDDDINKDLKLERLQKLLNLYKSLLKEKYQTLINSFTEVLVESFNAEQRILKGRNRRFEKVIFKGDISLVNTLQNVKIIGFKHQTLIGEKI
ncbi:MAG: tRNA (N6-isopentenyl adenosine(37)-C2)-methylthiotransferase MiaB [Chlamydiae bacterium RIFCSPLOWO2_01_FULL_28_7]|nr:MAG: tRNA (N6-isopentenyl adenosine(37)-C2)-methylthiotransferase MiaB [Chlamydiae bacterium RIFCSPLOWO2_01_FULL_28_7]